MIFEKPYKYGLTFFFILVTILGLVWSKFLISQGVIWLSVISLFSWDAKLKFPLCFNPQFIFLFRNIKQFLPQLSMIGLFLIPLIWGIGSSDTEYWMEKVRIRLPFLAFPLIFLILPKMSIKDFNILLLIFQSILTFTALGAVLNFFLHYEIMMNMLSRGQFIPVPLHHIRFSLMLAFSIFIGFYLYKNENNRKWIARFALSQSFLAIICLHILSVRSGIAVFYFLSIFILVKTILIQKNYILGIGLIIIIVLMPLAFYKMNSSFNTKINYSKWDFEQYLENNGTNYSDSERITSIIVGIEIFQKHPFFGVGTGDINNEVKQIYKDKFPSYENAKLPHNQIIVVLASQGIVGLLLFLFFYFYPLFYQKGYRSFLATILSLTIFLSFLVESTFETSQGVMMYAFIFSFIIQNTRKSEQF